MTQLAMLKTMFDTRHHGSLMVTMDYEAVEPYTEDWHKDQIKKLKVI